MFHSAKMFLSDGIYIILFVSLCTDVSMFITAVKSVRRRTGPYIRSSAHSCVLLLSTELWSGLCTKVNMNKSMQSVSTSLTHTFFLSSGDLPFPTEKWSKPQSEVKGWDDWLAMQGDLTTHLSPLLSGGNMKDLWTNASRPRPDDEDLTQSLWRVCSEFFSRPMTVAWGMRLFGLNPYSKPLTIHLVGAGHSETLASRLTDYDELSNMFPGHQGIEIVMVGPEVVDGPIVRPPLRAFGPKQQVYISAYKDLYHQFWEELVEKEKAAKPDLVVGFNPGTNITYFTIQK